MNTKKVSHKIISEHTQSLVIVLIGGAALAVVMQGLLSFIIPAPGKKSAETAKAAEIEQVPDPFKNVSLEAHSAYVFDLKTETMIFAKNAEEKLPLASVTKLMTTLVARDALSGSSVLTISKDDIAAEGDSGLRVGERWRLEDLINFTLIISSNDGAHAIASFVGANGQSENRADENTFRVHFIQLMNEKALELKLAQMEFFNESGLDVSATQNGGYGSAHNVADLFALLWRKYPGTIEMSARKDARIYSADHIAHIVPNTNEIVGHIPGLIASKTGFTDLAGGNLAIIFDKGIGEPVVAVVLGSSYKGRFDDMQKLVNAALLGSAE